MPFVQSKMHSAPLGKHSMAFPSAVASRGGVMLSLLLLSILVRYSSTELVRGLAFRACLRNLHTYLPVAEVLVR